MMSNAARDLNTTCWTIVSPSDVLVLPKGEAVALLLVFDVEFASADAMREAIFELF